MKTIRLRLDAPLQSWGIASVGSYRQTGHKPTKSGVIGLCSAALGYDFGDKRISELSDKLSFNVKTIKQGTIKSDYQIVRYGKGKNDVKQVYRFYIEDGVFDAYLTGEDDTANMVLNALRHPVYPIYLGRKSCPPTANFYKMLEEKEV